MRKASKKFYSLTKKLSASLAAIIIIVGLVLYIRFSSNKELVVFLHLAKSVDEISQEKANSIVSIILIISAIQALASILNFYIAEKALTSSKKSKFPHILAIIFGWLSIVSLNVPAGILGLKSLDETDEVKYEASDYKFGSSQFKLKVDVNFNAKRLEKRQKITKFIMHLIVYVLLILLAIVIIFPFYWMINSSLKNLEEFNRARPTFIPNTIVWSNYSKAFDAASLGKLFINTLYVGLISTILSLVITVLSAFAFARLEFAGKNILFAGLLATMMIPGELFTITNYATVVSFGWKDTFTAMIVPFLVSVFYIYLLRQNFLQIPNELYLAAKVDGTSDIKYLLRVMVPLSLPTLISITILKMMGAWNSYIWPRLVTTSVDHWLITNGLRTAFVQSDGNTDYPVQMAAVALVSLPLFIVFMFLRKYIMKGVSRSGIKG